MIKRGLNAYQLQLIAIFAMLIDHLAHIVINLNFAQSAAVATVMNCIGRLTMPIMCYFVAEGYHKTSNLKNYFIRLFAFAIIAQLPFYIFELSAVPSSLWDLIKANLRHVNVIFTLLMGLGALTAIKSEKFNPVVRIAAAAAALYLTRFSDWRYYGVLWVVIFGLFRGDFKKQAIFFALSALLRCAMNFTSSPLNFGLQMCVIFALPLLYLYNGEKGNKPKYGFYVFYPLHLLILGIIRLIIIT